MHKLECLESGCYEDKLVSLYQGMFVSYMWFSLDLFVLGYVQSQLNMRTSGEYLRPGSVLWCNALIAAVWGSPVEGQKCREEWLFRTLCASEVGGGGLERTLLFAFQCSIALTNSTIAAVFVMLAFADLEEECNVMIEH